MRYSVGTRLFSRQREAGYFAKNMQDCALTGMHLA
jgi:hypothetical protein